MKLLTKKDLQTRWAVEGEPVSEKTVRRRMRQLGLKACNVLGTSKVFRLSDVRKAERKFKKALFKRINGRAAR